MKIALCQFNTQDNIDKNLEKTYLFAKEASGNNCDIIVFPELWISSFSAKLFDEKIISDFAKELNIAICGSNAFLEKTSQNGQKPFNRFSFYTSYGEKLSYYDKVHLFSGLKEDKIFSKGNSISTFNYKEKVFAPSICYDVRFAQLYAKQASLGSQIFLISAAFPKPRHLPWEILLRARAIENQSFVIGVNRAGLSKLSNKTDIEFFGKSRAIDPLGNIISEFSSNEEGLLFANLDFALLEKTRNAIKCFNDKRSDLY